MKYLFSEIKYKLNEFFTNTGKNNKLIYKQLKKSGFVVIQDFIDNDKCQELIGSFNDKVKLDKVWIDDHASDFRLFGIDRVDHNYQGLFKTEMLTSIYKKYIDRFINHHFIMVNKVCFKDFNEGSGGGWHRDVINRRQLKFILYLNDVNEDNGCFQYIESSHFIKEKWKINRLLDMKMNEVRYEVDKIDFLLNKGYQSIKLTGKAGTLIIVDTSGIHRGSPIRNGERYAATQYMSDKKFGKGISDLLI